MRSQIPKLGEWKQLSVSKSPGLQQLNIVVNRNRSQRSNAISELNLLTMKRQSRTLTRSFTPKQPPQILTCKSAFDSDYILAKSRILLDRKTVGADGMHMGSALLRLIHGTTSWGATCRRMKICLQDVFTCLLFLLKYHCVFDMQARDIQAARDDSTPSLSFSLLPFPLNPFLMTVQRRKIMTQNLSSCSFRLVVTKVGSSSCFHVG